MNKILMGISLLLAVLTGYLLTRPPELKYLPPKIEIEKPIIKTPQYIDEINLRNQEIESVSYGNVTLQGLPVQVGGTINFQKNQNFRLKLFSKFGKEIDAGSNNDIFWFWSKRMLPARLYYCTHQNALRSCLRTPFNPAWIMETLGASQITGTVFKQGKYWAAFEIRQTTEGTTVIKSTMFDREKILGHYIFDLDGKILVSTEILEFQHVGKHILPLKIHTIWHEENVSMTWNLGTAVLNSSINPKEWAIPKITPKFELGR